MVKEKKSRKNLILVAFIAFIMVTSILGFTLKDSSSNNYVYNGYTFMREGDKWKAYVNDHYVSFDFLPSQVEDIAFGGFNLNSNKIYISYDPNQTDSVVEYSLSRLYTLLKDEGYTVVLACTVEEGCPDIPVVDCDKVQGMMDNPGVLKVEKTDGKAQIDLNGSCVSIDGKDVELIRSTDRIIYSILGVM